MAILTANRRKIENAIADGTTFIVASMSGTTTDGRGERQGRMDDNAWHLFDGDVRTGRVAYVVRSYNTVIGWRLLDGTGVVPNVKYSATTSNHQGIARMALNVSR